ncbi:cysteine desulfurase [Psychrosphaera ytuae]|uniref:cysteine desulfurase n=1 Tax=Psychrosphaera ytuae TaxID=2820710 RepID=A0A975D9R0_9GAMM|nr:cysteine desulfurase [Psychrosphaera ytuae]QTH63137.1 cysteine desulfurase [Psychrosphaera ytuae]
MFNEQELCEIKSEFSAFEYPTPTGQPLIYLDNAATALKPRAVVDAVTQVLTQKTANIHRSVHFLGDRATECYESARTTVSYFLNCDEHEVVFLKNTTEALNLVANAFASKGKILTSMAEHHSNYLVWPERQTIRLSLNQHGQVDLSQLDEVLTAENIELISLAHVSNVTGNEIPIEEVCKVAHRHGVKVLVDAAQSAPHQSLDVETLGCDFLVFSGHKLGSPTGVGVLFGKHQLLEEMDYWLKGGATVESVSLSSHKPKNAPWRFEAGTPAIESVAGLDSALTYLMELDMDRVHDHQLALGQHARNALKEYLPQAILLGEPSSYSGPLSFYVPGVSPHLLARGVSDRYSICIRSGYHCAQPLHDTINAPASLRLSHWVYNSEQDIETAIKRIAAFSNIVS